MTKNLSSKNLANLSVLDFFFVATKITLLFGHMLVLVKGNSFQFFSTYLPSSLKADILFPKLTLLLLFSLYYEPYLLLTKKNPKAKP